MEKKLTRTISFSDRKIIMKPIEGKGLIETWTTTYPTEERTKKFIKHKGVFYYLTSSVDKSQPSS
jgi:hypothetical protein